MVRQMQQEERALLSQRLLPNLLYLNAKARAEVAREQSWWLSGPVAVTKAGEEKARHEKAIVLLDEPSPGHCLTLQLLLFFLSHW